MDFYSYLPRTSRLGLATTLATGLVAFVLCLAFTAIVPKQSVQLVDYLGQKNLNLRSLIFYATAGGVHILLCTGGIIFFLLQLRDADSKLELKKTLIGILIGLAVILGIVAIACYMDINLVRQSYQERIRPLYSDIRLSFLLAKVVIPYLNVEFQPFALFPLILIAFGVAVAVVGCFWIAQNAIRFVNKAEELKRRDIVEMKRSVAQLITLTSIIFTTSTIATISLMQIGRDWIEPESARDAYIQVGNAMSIFWSACYTSVIGGTVLIPLLWIAGYTRRIQRQARYSGNRPSFYDHIYEVISFKGASQAGVAMLVPMITSVIAAVFGS